MHELMMQAHAIKSSSSYIGAHVLSHAAGKLEKYTKCGNIEEIKQSMPDLKEKFVQLKKELEEFLASMK